MSIRIISTNEPKGEGREQKWSKCICNYRLQSSRRNKVRAIVKSMKQSPFMSKSLPEFSCDNTNTHWGGGGAGGWAACCVVSVVAVG